MNQFDAAQGYADLGYHCIPVNVTLAPNGVDKLFDMPSWRDGRKFNLRSDWEGYSGIALNTGASGVVVVDIDYGNGKDGHAGLAEAGIELPDTPIRATSRSGGEHRFYRLGSTPVKSSSGALAQDVDIRAEGGMLVISPTTVVGHPDQAYRWHDGVTAVPVADLPVFPEELAQKLEIQSQRKISFPQSFSIVDVTPEQREWALSKMSLKLSDIAEAGDGERNRVLGHAVTRIIGLAKTIGEDLMEWSQKIVAAYHESGGDDEAQAVRWVGSAVRYASPEDPRLWLPADRERMFWDARPELRRVQQAAQAGMASPWAVLGALCVLVLADVPPSHRVITGIGGPDGGNLNLYSVLAAASGGGKGIATQVARHLWPSHVICTEVASGEALPRLFARRIKDPSGAYVDERIRDSAVIDAPEFGSLNASGARNGATLIQRLCSGFSGESLSFAVADESKNVEVPANSYRLGMITGIQYGNAGLLLAESSAVTGLPQRCLWFPGNVRAEEIPHTRPEMPEPLRRFSPAVGAKRIAVCQEAKTAIEEAQKARLSGAPAASSLDGHKPYARVKLAYALAVLNGHYDSVRAEDWDLAGIVVGVSDATRKRAVDALQGVTRKSAEAAGKAEGIKKAAAAQIEDEVLIDQAAERVSQILAKHPDGLPIRGKTGIRQMLRGTQRHYCYDAIELLIERGTITRTDGGSDHEGEPLGYIRTR